MKNNLQNGWLVSRVLVAIHRAVPEMSAVTALLSRNRKMKVRGFNLSVGCQHEEGTRDGVEGNTLDTVCICTSPNRIKLGKTTIVVF